MIEAQIRNRKAAFTFSIFALIALAPQAQTQVLPQSEQGTTVSTPAGPVQRKPIETTVSLGAAAQLTATRVTANGQILGSQSFDPSATVLGSVRQNFRPLIGYSANFGYTRTTEENRQALSYVGSRLAVPSNVYELSLAYMVQKHITPRLTGFADLGAGVLTFLPVRPGPTASPDIPRSTPVLFRQLGVAGVGVDYHFNARLGLRAEYRGLLYKYPDYAGLAGRQITVTSQPTLSVTYTFGKGKKR